MNVFCVFGLKGTEPLEYFNENSDYILINKSGLMYRKEFIWRNINNPTFICYNDFYKITNKGYDIHATFFDKVMNKLNWSNKIKNI